MPDFDGLNRQTRDYKSRCVTSPSLSTSVIRGTARPYSRQLENELNNRTFKAHNGQYSPKYF